MHSIDNQNTNNKLESKVMKSFFRNITFVCCLLGMTACGDDNDKIPEWPWGNKEEPAPDPEVTAKPRYVWIDAAGNFEQYANSQDNIKADLAKVKEAGFTDVIVDVRPTTGDVLFKSTAADALTKIDVWSSTGYIWAERTATWDYLQTFINEGHKLGLKVNASINTFVGGYLCPYGLGSIGMLYKDSSKKKWATVLNTANGLVNSMDLQNDEEDYGAKFLNPANNQVQEFILQILSDLAKYDLDGIVLDRCRYDDYQLMSDFSDESRTQFEVFVGESVANYPADILPAGAKEGTYATKWYKRWLAFRAKTIHDFMVKARNKVKSVNEDIRFGAYVGAWYSSYYCSGVNWASPKYDPSINNPGWASTDYKDYGYADHLGFIFLGAYAAADKIYGSGEWTMEGFCKQGHNLLQGDVPFAGGPDIGNSSGWTDGGQSAKIPNAIDACINNSDGFFVFDICHIRMYNYWQAFKTGIDAYLKSVEKK